MSPFPDARLRRAGANRAQIKSVMEHYSGLDEEARAEFEYEVAAVNDARLAELVADLDERQGPAYEPASEPASEPGGEPAGQPGGEPAQEPTTEPAGAPGGEPATASEDDGQVKPTEAEMDAHAAEKHGEPNDVVAQSHEANAADDEAQDTTDADSGLDDETAAAALETAKTVEAHIAEHPEHAADLAEREKTGRARKTVLALLDKAAPSPQE